MEKKVFITVGSQKFQFDRLLKSVDELCDRKVLVSNNVFAQTGNSDYIPKNYKFKKYLNRAEFDEEIDNANIIITHGGTGVILAAIKKGKKVIAIPRLRKYKEHVDDHQIQLLEQFRDLNLICFCEDTDLLDKAIDEVCNCSYNNYESNTLNIIKSIEKYIEDIWYE